MSFGIVGNLEQVIVIFACGDIMFLMIKNVFNIVYKILFSLFTVIEKNDLIQYPHKIICFGINKAL